MCGRAACGLAPDAICDACGHQNKDGQWTKPKWQDAPGGKKFYPSYNICPTSYAPVLLSKEHFKDQKCKTTEYPAEKDISQTLQCDWVIQPMRWGLIPHWHTGEIKSLGYLMTNARSDGMLTKRTFKGPLEKGRRCVVLIEGYYEWHTSDDGRKQPYFIYFPAAPSATVEEVNKELTDQAGVTDKVWSGRRILTLAGLFDIWRPKEDDPMYSFAIITVDNHKSMSWLHDRMPAVLNGEEEVREWLDFGEIPLQKATKLVRPVDSVTCHPVSSAVNDTKNKSEECMQPFDLEKQRQKEAASSNLMKAWLRTSQTKRPAPSCEESKTDIKKLKTQSSDNHSDFKWQPKVEVKKEIEEGD